MSYLLEDGQTRMIQGGRHRRFKVVAERVDCDTPFIHVYDGSDYMITFTDADASLLAEDIKAALKILPTSK